MLGNLEQALSPPFRRLPDPCARIFSKRREGGRGGELTIEAVYLQVWRKRQPGLQRVDPFRWHLLVPLNLRAGEGNSVRIISGQLVLVPIFGNLEKELQAIRDCRIVQIRRCVFGSVLENCPKTHPLARLVIGSPS